MAEEQSSLRTAIDQIMGWPAGGGQQGTGGTTPSPGFGPAPAPSGPVNLGTTSDIANTIAPAAPDPFAAELAEIQAQNAALEASLTPASTAAATRPTGLEAGKEWLTFDEQMRRDMAASGITGATAEGIISETLAKGGYTPETMFDPTVMAMNPDVAAGPNQAITTQSPAVSGAKPGTTYQNKYGTWDIPTASLTLAAGSPAKKPPVNPGPKAPWQQSQQYWKDLAAYQGK